jgi:hypothetical protein
LTGADATPWIAPPRGRTGSGATRRIGVEIEFAGVSVGDAAAVVQKHFGGDLHAESVYRVHVAGTTCGDFAVEIDMSYAHKALESETGRALRDAVVDMSSAVVPVEIVCPPIAWDAAHALDALRADLRAMGAEGTRESFFYAFGVQLNPELPALDVGYVLSCLRAFVLLREWLRREIDVDASRRIWLFESPFPGAYCARILDPSYAPDLAGFIEDYLRANPTRDRELDLLPLLCHLDAARVRRRLPAEKINPRPTWHYRLPNSEVSRGDWTIGREWARWVRVERLAENAALLREAADAWLENHARLLPRDGEAASASLAARL